MDLAPGVERTTTDDDRKAVARTRVGTGTFRMSPAYSRSTWYQRETDSTTGPWIVQHDTERMTTTDTMVPNGAIITDINEHRISDATSATELHEAIRDASDDVLVTVRMRTRILVGGGRGNVAARAKLAYRDTRVKLDDGSWGAICDVFKQTQENQPSKRRKTRKQATERATWRVTIRGEDGTIAPHAHSLTEEPDKSSGSTGTPK